MPTPVTITGELRLPAAFMQERSMEEIEQQLCDAGVLPAQAQERRWRMDHDYPGGYILMFTLVVPLTR